MNKRLIGVLSASGLLLSGLGGAAALDTASATAKTHTIKFVAKGKGSHGLGRFVFAGVDVDKKKGDVVGYDTFTARFDPQTEKIVLHVAVARKDGILLGRLTGDDEGGDLTGKVTGGSGKFRGATGTIDTFDTPAGNTKVTIKWLK